MLIGMRGPQDMTDHRRLLGVSLALAVLALTAACETAAERAAREEREAYIESLDLDKLKEGLETVNPDPYDPKTAKPLRRQKQN